LLPDGRHFLFLATGNQPEYDGIGYIGSVDAAERRRLFKSDSQIVYAAGHLLYMLDNTLLARPFDAASLRLTGEPAVIAEHVERTAGSRRGAFTLSETGVLAYRLQNETQLVWYDRDGRRGEVLGRPGHYRNPALSPDDKMLAVGLLDANTGDSDLWTIDVARNAAVRLTAPSSSDDMPAWSPDGTQIAFKSYGTSRGTDRRNAFYRRLASGTGEPELLLSNLRPSAALHAWTAEDLVYSEITSTRDYDLFRLPLVGARKPARILGTPLSDAFCQLSPDGRLMAYASNQSGAFEIYVSAFPSDRDRIQISTKGGTEPAWRRDGKELFYLSPERKVMAAAINSGSRPSAGSSQPLFEAAVSSLINPSYTRNQYVVSGDGQRFLVNEPLGRASLSSVVVVINWPAVFDQSSARSE
jgi:eukaryotic-like serine/threonine-protein kinase